LLLDEADTFVDGNEELRGILNSGHTGDQAYVIRCNPVTLEPERFSVWCPKSIALIGSLSGTLADRSIEIRMERKTRDRK
jgi:putative DNA primase/helicase